MVGKHGQCDRRPEEPRREVAGLLDAVHQVLNGPRTQVVREEAPGEGEQVSGLSSTDE